MLLHLGIIIKMLFSILRVISSNKLNQISIFGREVFSGEIIAKTKKKL